MQCLLLKLNMIRLKDPQGNQLDRSRELRLGKIGDTVVQMSFKET